jgi:hypothetical protein
MAAGRSGSPGSQMTGNPVKIGGGCATVKGYELPGPLLREVALREGGSKASP